MSIFKDFTLDNYRRLIRIAKDNYEFVSFKKFKSASSNNLIVWRHDIDFSTYYALKMAKIDAAEGIDSTFFINMHSEFYNLFECEDSKNINNIIKLNRNIGLHIDTHYYGIRTEKELNRCLKLEKAFIEKNFDTKIYCFSFHINDKNTMKFEKCSYGGLINVYSSYYKKRVEYCSDSNGYWRYKRLEDVLTQSQSHRLQVLTHDALWQEDVMSPKSRVYSVVDQRATRTKAYYDDLLRTWKSSK